jgi:hypothetical protein
MKSLLSMLKYKKLKALSDRTMKLREEGEKTEEV